MQWNAKTILVLIIIICFWVEIKHKFLRERESSWNIKSFESWKSTEFVQNNNRWLHFNQKIIIVIKRHKNWLDFSRSERKHFCIFETDSKTRKLFLKNFN
jgi:hypothetical protein